MARKRTVLSSFMIFVAAVGPGIKTTRVEAMSVRRAISTAEPVRPMNFLEFQAYTQRLRVARGLRVRKGGQWTREMCVFRAATRPFYARPVCSQ